MRHLTLRVAWHDRAWDGSVCDHPSNNAFCVAPDRVREERNLSYKDGIAGQPWAALTGNNLPPCRAEASAFMNAREWMRIIQHPCQENRKAEATHGRLRPTPVKVPPYSTFCIPSGGCRLVVRLRSPNGYLPCCRRTAKRRSLKGQIDP